MPLDTGKVRVLIATTSGPVEVLLLTEEDAAIGRCVACIGGTTETADIAAAYHAFVVRPTGLIETLFGHSCYRLDVSARIDAGSSWQLGVLAAHALHAEGRLAQENDIADGVLWATGSVRSVDRSVGGVSHVPEKLAKSIDRLKQEAAAGRGVLLALPLANASELSDETRSELRAHAIESLDIPDVATLLGQIGIEANGKPETVAAIAETPDADAPASHGRHYLLGAAAAALLVVLGTVAVGYRSGGKSVNAAHPPGEQLAASPAPTKRVEQATPVRLVPELVPFISARDQSTIRENYLPAPDYKAIATSLETLGYVTNQPNQAAADAAALEACEKDNSIARANANLPPVAACDLYASGDLVVSRRRAPPMPPAPWVIPNPTVERPFVASELPLLSARNKALAERNYRKRARSKVFVLSPRGNAKAYSGEPSPEEAMRRALQVCGYEYGQVCMVIAVDDTFVVPIPTMARAVGIYQPDALTNAQPGVREDVARRLANATNGWNAVAVGANGQAGIKVGAGSEQAAVESALVECAKHDRDCSIAVIGPFLVRQEADGEPDKAPRP